jgi:hypothetical protein
MNAEHARVMYAHQQQAIRDNCALGDKCKCTTSSKPWQCENWGRSTRGNPAIIGRDASYGPGGQKVARPKS